MPPALKVLRFALLACLSLLASAQKPSWTTGWDGCEAAPVGYRVDQFCQDGCVVTGGGQTVICNGPCYGYYLCRSVQGRPKGGTPRALDRSIYQMEML